MLGSIVLYLGKIGPVTGVTDDGRLFIGRDVMFWVDPLKRKQYRRGGYNLRVEEHLTIVAAPAVTDVHLVAEYQPEENEFWRSPWEAEGRVGLVYLERYTQPRWQNWVKKHVAQLGGFTIHGSYLAEEAPTCWTPYYSDPNTKVEDY